MKSFEKEAYGYIKDMFVQHNMVKRVIMTVISIVVMGFGISLFSVSGLNESSVEVLNSVFCVAKASQTAISSSEENAASSKNTSVARRDLLLSGLPFKVKISLPL